MNFAGYISNQYAGFWTTGRARELVERKGLFLFILFSFYIFCVSCPACLSDELPPGFYIFIGRTPGSSSPRYVLVNDDGTIRWDASINQSGKDKGGKQTSTVLSQLQKANEPEKKGEFESYDYPFIKWKPKILPTGALVQLETTFEGQNNSSEFVPGYSRSVRGSGTLKYKVNVFGRGNILIPSQGLQIDLLDKRGFSLVNFPISASAFGLITGTSVMEARGTYRISEDDYRKAADFSAR